MHPYPASECGVVAATEQILARSDHAALLLRVAVANTTGLQLAMTALLRDPADERWHDDVTSTTGDGLEMNVSWNDPSDGHWTPVAVSRYDSHPAMSLIAAGGGGAHYEITLWLSPLPDAGGTLRIYTRWLRLNIIESSASIQIPTRRAIKARAQRLWS